MTTDPTIRCAALAAALALPEVRAMREALEEIERQFSDTPGGHMACVIARAALAAMKGGGE